MVSERMFGWLFALFFLLCVSTAVETDPNDQMRLSEFYSQLSSKGSLSWDTNSGLCDQTGVFCDDSGKITSLSLPNKLLQGTISESLFNLTSLSSIFLQGNQLSGTLSTKISYLSHLTSLVIPENSLEGDIPETIGELEHLEYLQLSENSLTGIPTTIGLLSALTNLQLSGNSIIGSIPSELTNLGKLKNLYLDRNSLTGEIPQSINNLVSLEEMRLNENSLSGTLPSSIGLLPKVAIINLSKNQFTGEIPTSLSNLGLLIELDLSGNMLSGAIPSELGQIPSLLLLDISSNALQGTLPSAFGTFPSLNIMRLNNNQISGTIPSQLGNVLSLIDLRLDNNQLTGSIPAKLNPLPLRRFHHLRLQGSNRFCPLDDYSSWVIYSHDYHVNNHCYQVPVPVYEVEVATRGGVKASTTGNITFEFVGSFASTGPIFISQGFASGEVLSLQIPLEDHIGDLHSIIARNSNPDDFWKVDYISVFDSVNNIAYPFGLNERVEEEFTFYVPLEMKIKTSEDEGAGTLTKIYCTFVDQNGKEETRGLQEGFEEGSVSTFSLEFLNLDLIDTITFGSFSIDDWIIDYVEIRQRGVSFLFRNDQKLVLNKYRLLTLQGEVF